MEENKAGPSFRRRSKKQSHPQRIFHNPIKEAWEEIKRKLEGPSLPPPLSTSTSSPPPTPRGKFLWMRSNERAQRIAAFVESRSNSSGGGESSRSGESSSSSESSRSGGGGSETASMGESSSRSDATTAAGRRTLPEESESEEVTPHKS